MAAVWRAGLRQGWLRTLGDCGAPSGLPGALRREGFRTSAACGKNRAARVRVGKGDKPVTYEEAHPPHHIAHRKGWLSLHPGTLSSEGGAAERSVEDVFVRRFVYGTFHGCLANEVVLKRRANGLLVCVVLLQRLPPSKLYFLIGYTETLLSFLYKIPVRMEVQTVPEKVIYKHI